MTPSSSTRFVGGSQGRFHFDNALEDTRDRARGPPAAQRWSKPRTRDSSVCVLTTAAQVRVSEPPNSTRYSGFEQSPQATQPVESHLVPAYIEVAKTGPAIRAALKEASPDELPDFEAEFHTAIAEADDDFDTSRIERVLTRWWGIAHVRLNPIPMDEREAAKKAGTDDLAGESYTRENGRRIPSSSSSSSS